MRVIDIALISIISEWTLNYLESLRMDSSRISMYNRKVFDFLVILANAVLTSRLYRVLLPPPLPAPPFPLQS